MPAALRVLHSNSTGTVLAALAPLFERATGIPVHLLVDSGKGMRERIQGGEVADAVVLGTGTLRQFAQEGILLPDSIRRFAHARVAVAVRKGDPRPDIGTVDALRQSLLDARAVAHTVHGASGQYIPVLFDRLGIGEPMRGKTVTRPGGYIGPVVVSGEADLALQQLPELLAVDGLDIVGLLPESVQKVLETSMAIFSASVNAQACGAFLDFSNLPMHREMFRSRGLEQVSGAPA